MMTAAIMCSDSLDDVAKLDAIAPDIRAFIESIEPPAYPFDIDEALAATGRTVFEGTCSQCHGTYGEQPTYPNRIVDIAIVGTDDKLIEYALVRAKSTLIGLTNHPSDVPQRHGLAVVM